MLASAKRFTRSSSTSATRADGTVVRVRTYRGQSLPDVNAYRLEGCANIARRAAALLPSDFNIKRRDALDQVRALRNTLVTAHYAAKAS
jgi:hypothetical protein